MYRKTGPSSAFEKWSGHEISKTFYECRRLFRETHAHAPETFLEKFYISGRP